MNILLGAFFISAYEGSESGLGWKIATELAKHHKVTVLCGDLGRNGWRQRDTRRALEEGIIPPNLHIEVVGPNFATWLCRKIHAVPGLWFFYYLGYQFWLRKAYRHARTLHQTSRFDVVHQVNIISYRVPGHLWKLGIPYFWGPVAGAVMVPPAFVAEFSPQERRRWTVRNKLNQLQKLFAPGVREAAEAAEKVWAVSADDVALLSRYKAQVEPMIETGTAADGNKRVRRLNAGQPLVLCWSGQFNGIKALPLLLRALDGIRERNWQLHVLGDGPEKTLWLHECHALNLDHKIKFHGQLQRDHALAIMLESDVLVHSSVKEGTPHVVLEALASGMPVVCHDACGMGIAVDATCGIKVLLESPATSVNGFQRAIERILNEPELLQKLSTGAVKRGNELSWANKVGDYLCAYAEACENK
jgi:glycosyltransferase involved in cell wall biosynthesis